MQIRLTSTGARSGDPRTATLYAWEDGDRLIVVGSRGGASRDPAWAHNLRAHPSAQVQLGREIVEMSSREVTDRAERDRLWRLVVSRFPLYATYAARTKRVIPLFVLEPRASAAIADGDATAPTEFPSTIGRVATRALALNGYTRFEQLTRVSRRDLLRIHGIGPKAVRILEEELAARGLSFARDGWFAGGSIGQ